MIRLFGLWVVGGALCVTPVAADEGVRAGFENLNSRLSGFSA